MNTTLLELNQRETCDAVITWYWDSQLDIHEIKVDMRSGPMYRLIAEDFQAAKDKYNHPHLYELEAA
jgi:hypothetical protein